jgi:hypothetical protein
MTKRMTPEECQAKAAECRELAKGMQDPAHQLMVDHIAETWERICRDMKKTETH